MNGQLILLSLRSTITSPTVIAIAVVVLALVVLIGGFLVYRSGGKKSGKATTGAGNSDWQRQQQQGGANSWNPQGMNNDAPAWSQQNQAQQGGWGGQNNPQQPQQPQQPAWGSQQNGQMQQQGASPWGSQQHATGPAWGDAQGGMPQQQQQPSWGGGMQNGQQGGNQWAAPANPGPQPASANQWEAQGNPNSMGGRAAWDANPAPVTQEPWGQPPTASPQPQWGGQANNAAMPQQQQAQTAFGGGSGPSWNQQGFAGMGQNGQNAQSDGWGAPPPQQQYAPQSANNAMGGFGDVIGSVPQAPSWQQQQQGGFNQGGPNMQPNQGVPFGNMDAGFGANDGDKTIMRPAGGIGLVRVEEGKEPGREYKIVKESLSIGRSRESDIFLEDLAVSRLHASVVNLGNGQYALKDEGSANGTKVNGQLVGKFQTFPLQESDRIQLGQTVLVFARS